jgi:hypothetical protein
MEKVFSAKIENISDREIRFIISDETEDRVKEIMLSTGCDFSNFAKNPQFLGFHDKKDWPLGQVKSWGIDSTNRNVWMIVRFPTIEELSSNPGTPSEKATEIDTVYNMYRLNMLSAVSIGFIEKDSSPNPTNSIGRIITQWELLEVSAVPVPMNPNALAEARSMKSLDQKTVDQMEKAMKENNKSGAKFSKETIAAHSAIQSAMSDCHNAYVKEMAGHMKTLADFMTDPGNVDSGEEVQPDEDDKKSLDISKVSEHLRNCGNK